MIYSFKLMITYQIPVKLVKFDETIRYFFSGDKVTIRSCQIQVLFWFYTTIFNSSVGLQSLYNGFTTQFTKRNV